MMGRTLPCVQYSVERVSGSVREERWGRTSRVPLRISPSHPVSRLRISGRGGTVLCETLVGWAHSGVAVGINLYKHQENRQLEFGGV